MSFKDILGAISNLLENKSAEEITEAVSAIYDLTSNGKTPPTASPRKKNTTQHQTKVSTLPVEDWLSVNRCSVWINQVVKHSTTPAEIEKLVENGIVDTYNGWCSRLTFVHRRQVARWLMSHETLDVSQFVENASEWVPMSHAANLIEGASLGGLSSAIERGAIACHAPDARCKVVNLNECIDHWGDK